MFRLKRKHSHSSSSSHENKDNRHSPREKTVAASAISIILSIATIVLVKLQIYTLKLISILVSPKNRSNGEDSSFFKRYHPFHVVRKGLHWLLLMVLSMLHFIARTLYIEALTPLKKQEDEEGNRDYRKKQRSSKSKAYINNARSTDNDAGTLDAERQIPRLTQEEEMHLKKLLDFVNYGTR